jgi:methylenetetrahydrofolate reductase (NADPH)
MWNMFGRGSKAAGKSSTAGALASPDVQRVVSALTFELVPLKNLADQIRFLPAGSRVSVTCSPAKGIDHTLQLSHDLRGMGLVPTPHLAARQVQSQAHAAEIAHQLSAIGCEEAFVIAGDAEQPAGPYAGAVEFLADFAWMPHRLRRIGIAGYPDGHLLMGNVALSRALHAKQEILRTAGVQGWVSTQMCFDRAAIVNWLRVERACGLSLPVRLGVPGPVDKTKLLTMGMRVGVGQSLRYLQKNRAGLSALALSAYDPSELLEEIGPELTALGVEGLHLFTFNQLEGAVAWRHAVLS